jgi:hypothetical protein
MPCSLGKRSVGAVAAALVWLLIASSGAGAAGRAATRVPSVIGLDLGHAYARLHQAGFRVTYPRSFSAGSLSCAPVIGKQRPIAGALSRLPTVTLTPQPPRCAAPSLALPTGPLPSALVPRFEGQSLLVAARWATTNELYWQVNRLPALRNGCWPQLLSNYAIVRQNPKAGMTLRLGIAHRHGQSGSFLPTPLKLTALQRGCSNA